MNIIFTQIDGVLNDGSDSLHVEHAFVSNLNQLILGTAGIIVMIPSWQETMDFYKVANKLYDGKLLRDSIFSATPVGMDTLESIILWLKEARGVRNNFIILGSGIKDIEATPLGSKYVDMGGRGFSEEKLQEALQKFRI